MGNQHSASHATLKPRKNVHWKSAGRPAVPGKPEIIPVLSDDEPNAITLRWGPAVHDGGAPLQGYQVECNRLGSAEWIRTAPPVVQRPELVLTGLEPPHRYQFRVAALNTVGPSDYSELSDVLTVSSDRSLHEPPIFLHHLEDITALENDKTEFRVSFTGLPPPTIAWFKDDYEIFSSRRTAITTNDSSSVLVFHQTQASDEGEIKCTATNRAGHAVTKARLSLEAAPKLRYPRQYEDGLLYEINETVFLKTTIVGKPTPTVEWRHNGQPIVADNRVEVSNTPKFSMLKIHSARRSDRGEYQIQARNSIGEDTAAFLVTITAPPDPPRHVSVTRQVDKSVTLDWEPPDDDGGCRIGNYVVEYYRTGWNVWLKATTSRKTNVTLFDLIEGSEYRFRVKAESPYGMSAPSMESAPVRIPGRPVDMEFLAVESRIITDVLVREEGEEPHVSPAPRRKRAQSQGTPHFQDTQALTLSPRRPSPIRRTASPSRDHTGSNEFMLVLYPENKSAENAEKRKSFQLDLEDALSPPPLSLSAPDLSSRCILPFKALRNACSSTELLHERAMARFYKAVAMEEEQSKLKAQRGRANTNNNIPYNTSHERNYNDERDTQDPYETPIISKCPEIYYKPADKSPEPNHKIESNHTRQVTTSNITQSNSKIPEVNHKTPEIFIKTDSIEDKHFKYSSRQTSQDSDASTGKWQTVSFDEDYTASTVSTEGDYSDGGSLDGDIDRYQIGHNEDTYNPRDKLMSSPRPESVAEEEEESERESLKPLPIPDPNFIPKPILKRREPEIPEQKISRNYESEKYEEKLKSGDKPEKEEKMTIFKKFAKMPVQKPFPFPKILKKKEDKSKDSETTPTVEPPKSIKKVEKIDQISDEGRTVIDYYGSIVKEYGSQKKTTTPLYLNTDDLKTAAAKQKDDSTLKLPVEKKIVKVRKIKSKPGTSKITNAKTKTANSTEREAKSKTSNQVSNKTALEKKIRTVKPEEKENKAPKKCTQQIVLKTTERATIVIPIDYEELEEKAKENVRSAIDYMVDICLLLLAFWVYFFKDERLAIPFLILIIYRQLQETLTSSIPEWVETHTPNWLKKKTS